MKQGDIALQLDNQTQAILDRQLHGVQDGKQRPPRTVFAYANSLDIVVIVVSSVAAVIAGALNPLLTIIYGQLVGVIQGFSNGTIPGSELRRQISRFTLYYVYLAIACFVFIYIATVGFYWAGERITYRLRKAYLKAVLRQNMSFFDTLGAGEVTTRITSDMSVIQEGITSKISLTLTAVATFVTAFIVGLIEYWRLALILSSVIVAITITGSVGGKTAIKYSKQSSKASHIGGSIAEEAINSIRHVTAFGLQDVFATKYDQNLAVAERSGVTARVATALTVSVMMTVPYFSYGLSFWQGSRYLVEGQVDSAAIVTTTFAILIGAFSLGRIAPNAQAFVQSIASASAMLQTIARQSPQDPFDQRGSKPAGLDGRIQLKNLSMVYPSRSDVLALDNVNLEVPAGKTTAIVGASGCGKSSIIGLLQRFYEPTAGTIYLDKNDFANLNLKWLRQQIAYVSQEPILFDTTIRENIVLGMREEGTAYNADAVDEMVTSAARKANAHDFIASLPLGYDTLVGQKGLQLSGGQRQRIALARALVSEPRILLLDEATSSLDSRSEKIVQKALDVAAQSRTTIMIAHRLSTVRNADNIVVMSKGRIVEQGSHEELMQLDGFYAQLVARQAVEQEQERSTDDEFELSSAEPDNSVINEKMHIIAETITTRSDLEVTNTNILTKPGKAVSERSRFSFWGTIWFILGLNRKEGWMLAVALLCCFLAGVIITVQSVFLAEMIEALSYTPDQYPVLRSHVNFWSLMFLMIAIVALIAWIGQGLCFSVSTERLTRRARLKTFRSIMRQQIAFFDEKDHSAGAMTALLSTSTTDLNSLNGAVLGNILTFMSVLISGLITSLIIGWKLALVCATTIPVVAACGWIRLRMLAVFDSKVRKSHQESATYASEAIVAIRVVASFGLEDHVLNEYGKILTLTASRSLTSILKASALYAMSQSFTFLCSALGYWYGGTLIASHEYTLLQFFICFASLVTGSQIAGSIFSYAPDISKAMHAACDLASLFKRQPDIDVWSESGEQINAEKSNGRIEIEDVSFRYPSRLGRVVLNKFSLTVRPGQFVALVGASGCGKSTIISLLERFYDPEHGKIKLDGRDISKLNLHAYRSMISLVGQEPIVYMGTIKENILLGTDGNVSEERLAEVCKAANIYDFIISLPGGFDTDVGARGNMLSGGQKQRIAIARALLRDPKVLLLDEATSALDSESEQLVQAGLDAAAKGRTTIAIAHRLSTIQRADMICVVDGGKIVEKGSHNELMAKRGQYYELVQMQMLEEGAKSIEMSSR